MFIIKDIGLVGTYYALNKNKKKIKLSKIQKYTYRLIKVPMMTYCLYKNFINKNVDKVFLYIMTPVYFMGLYYTIYLFYIFSNIYIYKCYH